MNTTVSSKDSVRGKTFNKTSFIGLLVVLGLAIFLMMAFYLAPASMAPGVARDSAAAARALYQQRFGEWVAGSASSLDAKKALYEQRRGEWGIQNVAVSPDKHFPGKEKDDLGIGLPGDNCLTRSTKVEQARCLGVR